MKHIHQKMDNIYTEESSYGHIFDKATIILIAIVDICILLVSNGCDFDFEFIQSSFLKLVLQIIFQVILVNCGNFLILFLVTCYEKQKWIKNNKNKWIQGEWLHIHEKPDIRIGVVNIKQKFSNIEVKAINISPNCEGVRHKKETSWTYTTSKLFPKELQSIGIEMVGCYTAYEHKNFSGTKKQGVHIFDIFRYNSEQYPKEIIGYFNDTVSLKNGNIENIEDKIGMIYMYRVNDNLKEYLTNDGSISLNRLTNVLDIDELEKEDFVIRLKKVIAEQKEKQGISQIENV